MIRGIALLINVSPSISPLLDKQSSPQLVPVLVFVARRLIATELALEAANQLLGEVAFTLSILEPSDMLSVVHFLLEVDKQHIQTYHYH